MTTGPAPLTPRRARPKIAPPAEESVRAIAVQVEAVQRDERLARAFAILLEAGESAEEAS
jgi:hypothetical protein